MTPVAVALAVAYAAVAGLLLTLNLATRFALWIKALGIVLVTGLYGITWVSLGGLMGWATAEPLPGEFRVLWIATDEPEKASRTPGSIYYWVRELDAAGLPVGAPRAHSVPWSEEAAEAAADAMARIEEGELLNGRLGRGVVAEQAEASEEAAYAGEDSVTGNGGQRPVLEFVRVPPPALPAKAPPR